MFGAIPIVRRALYCLCHSVDNIGLDAGHLVDLVENIAVAVVLLYDLIIRVGGHAVLPEMETFVPDDEVHVEPTTKVPAGTVIVLGVNDHAVFEDNVAGAVVLPIATAIICGLGL